MNHREVVIVLGRRIKAYMDEKGIKYSFVAEKINMPMNVLSPILNGKRKIEAEEYFKICRALDVPLDKFEKAG